jgi:hypothetical protein
MCHKPYPDTTGFANSEPVLTAIRINQSFTKIPLVFFKFRTSKKNKSAPINLSRRQEYLRCISYLLRISCLAISSLAALTRRFSCVRLCADTARQEGHPVKNLMTPSDLKKEKQKKKKKKTWK